MRSIPAEAPSGGREPAEGAFASGGPAQADPASHHPAERIPVRLLTGDWLCGATAGFVDRRRNAHALSMPGLLHSLRRCGGSMRGRRLELLFVDALCSRHPAPTAKCPLGSHFQEYRVLTLDRRHTACKGADVARLAAHLSGSVSGDDRAEHLQPICGGGRGISRRRCRACLRTETVCRERTGCGLRRGRVGHC
jgi:hypothetical protein